MGTVEVLPDVTGIDRTFHYELGGAEPRGLPLPVHPGTIVRVELHGRRVRGWVVALDTPVPPGVELRPVREVVSEGPPPEVTELCGWVAWRWAGRRRAPLLAASPERVVRRPLGGPWEGGGADPGVAVEGWLAVAVASALEARDAVLRVPPAAERMPVVEAALAASPGGPALVLCESRADVERLSERLGRSGWDVAVHPDQWGRSARVTIGTRNAAFAPLTPALTVVLDAHSEAYRSERSPTFDARAIVAERAHRSHSRVLFVTPCPSLELESGEGRSLVTLPQSTEREGWGTIGVLDAREEDPAERGYPSRLVAWIREAADRDPSRPVVCVLNRTGRARLLACGMCRSLQRCPRCGSAQAQRERPAAGSLGLLTCPRCGDEEPAICPSCGSARLQVVRAGVARAREQLEAVTGLPVGEVSGPRAAVPPAPVLIGTQAVLHRVGSASLVAWLDFDQELLAPRFRGSEEALGLLARSVRLVGGRRRGGRVVVRTSMPEHEAVRAAQLGDPGNLAAEERARREQLSLPPFSALARVDGPAAAELVARITAPVLVSQVGESGYVLRAPSPAVLADALAAAAGVGGWAELDARVEVDPIDL